MSNRLALPFTRSDFARMPGNAEIFSASPWLPATVPRTGTYPSSLMAYAAEEVEREEVPIDELSFCHLRGEAEIAGIKHLRGELQLPVSALADPDFRTREKKETKWGSSALSSAAAGSSGPFASCRCSTGLRRAQRSCASSRRLLPAIIRTAGK